jgi:hypothetical protein
MASLQKHGLLDLEICCDAVINKAETQQHIKAHKAHNTQSWYLSSKQVPINTQATVHISNCVSTVFFSFYPSVTTTEHFNFYHRTGRVLYFLAGKER